MEDLKKIIRNKRKRLSLLEQRAAITGFNTAPEVLIEIEDLEKELQSLNDKLKRKQ